MGEISTGKREILLPETIDGKIRDLIALSQETRFVLLSELVQNPEGLTYSVRDLFMIAIGDLYHAGVDNQRVEVVKQFRRNNPNYRIINGHTHVGDADDRFLDELSREDLDYFVERVRQTNEYLHLVATPNKRILVAYGVGEGRTSLKVIGDPPDYAQKNRFVSGGIERAIMELGYSNLPRLQATRKI